MGASDADAALTGALRAVLGVGEVDGLVRLTGGASRETFRLRADGRSLILQRQRRGAGTGMTVEAHVLAEAARLGVAVAPLVASGSDPVIGGSYLISEAVEGETVPRRILREERFAAARAALPAQMAESLARLHRGLDPDALGGLAEDDQVTQQRAILDGLGQPHPAFELALRWLEEHRQINPRRAVVHGDFRMGNLIVDESGLAAVLDWELVHISDPMEDLGWLCARAWRFGSQLPVAGVGTYEQLFDAYCAVTGEAVDPAAVHWWEVLATLKWGVICIMQAYGFLSGAVPSHELAAIGRRVCETEYDLFEVLEGRW